MTMTSAELRERILRERGLLKQKAKKGVRRSRLVRNPADSLTVKASDKTDKMRYLEIKYGKPIEVLLLSGSLTEVVKSLHDEVDFTTVSKWIKKLKLRYSITNMPSCNNCPRWNPVCQAGYCSILADKEQYDLLEVKRKELMGEH